MIPSIFTLKMETTWTSETLYPTTTLHGRKVFNVGLRKRLCVILRQCLATCLGELKKLKKDHGLDIRPPG
jgi:hypothetical protein